jgi:hypothetical protein
MNDMKKINLGLFFGTGIAIVFFSFVFQNTAYAYALNATATAPSVTTTATQYLKQANDLMHSTSSLPAAPSWLTDAINSVVAWFGSVTAEGSQSTGAPQLSIGGASGPLGTITQNLQRAFQSFDAWFYSIFRFHISILFNFIFGVVIWILGLAQNVVNWLASLFK